MSDALFYCIRRRQGWKFVVYFLQDLVLSLIFIAGLSSVKYFSFITFNVALNVVISFLCSRRWIRKPILSTPCHANSNISRKLCTRSAMKSIYLIIPHEILRKETHSLLMCYWVLVFSFRLMVVVGIPYFLDLNMEFFHQVFNLFIVDEVWPLFRIYR